MKGEPGNLRSMTYYVMYVCIYMVVSFRSGKLITHAINDTKELV